MLPTETAEVLGWSWLILVAAWSATTYIVRALTWLDDGDGTLFPGVFSSLTDSNADWKRRWMLDGFVLRIAERKYWRKTKYAEYDYEDRYVANLLVGCFLFGVVGGLAVFLLAHVGLYVLIAGFAIASLYGGRCVVRARKQTKES